MSKVWESELAFKEITRSNLANLPDMGAVAEVPTAECRCYHAERDHDQYKAWWPAVAALTLSR
jgi:hypothetical protein